MSGLEQEFDNLVNKFFDIYDDAVINAQTLLGDLYHQDNYPPVHVLQSKFSWRMSFVPLPTSGDFRVDMGNEQEKALREDYDKHYNSMFGKAIDNMIDKLVVYLKNVSERLDYQDNEDKKVFRDTLTSNVTSMIEDLLVPMSDQDSRLKTLSRQLSDIFQGVSPDALREDDVLRHNTKQGVDDAINSIKSLGW